MYLDALFNKRLFQPDAAKQETKLSLAGEEAVKTKRCLQALRHLWRNTQQKSHCPAVQEMKDYLCPSPTQEMNANGPDPDDASQSSDKEHKEPVNVNMEDEVEGGSESGDSDSGESQDDMGDQKQGRIAQYDVCRVDDGDSSPQKTEKDESNGSDNESLLRAPTLRLDDFEATDDLSSSQASEEEWQDSQVSSNWLGKFYSKYGRFGKDENSDPNLPEYVKQDNRVIYLQHIRDTFKGMDREIFEQLCKTFKF